MHPYEVRPRKDHRRVNRLLATSVLVTLALSAGYAGQPDPRFYGLWVGAETYEIPAQSPVKKSAMLAISDSGKTLAFGQGLLQGIVEISASWGQNTLDFKARSPISRRTHGTLILSADGKTLTETALALLPRAPGSVATCNISGMFHRQREEVQKAQSRTQ
jgi:hypothetical protein